MSVRTHILCIGAGYVGGPTMAMIAAKCGDVDVTVVDLSVEKIAASTHYFNYNIYNYFHIGALASAHAWHHHDIAGPDPEDQQREMETGGAARQGDRVRQPRRGGEFPFERVEVGPDGCDPVRVEGAEQEVALLGAHVGR